jgi:hypothetical protein
MMSVQPRATGQMEEARRLGELCRKFADGEIPEDEWDRLPWQDQNFLRYAAKYMVENAKELREHRVRFKALRDVFGPGGK